MINIMQESIWDFQPHFREMAKVKAKSVFNSLDVNFKPEVFLIGVPFGDNSEDYVVLEPQDCGYNIGISSEKYQKNISEVRIKTDEGIIKINTSRLNGTLQERMNSTKNALLEDVKKLDNEKGVVTFCSNPVLINGFLVFIFLQLMSKTFNQYYTLKKSYAKRFLIARSLIDATVMEFMNICTEELKKNNPGSDLDIFSRDHEEIIRVSGKFLTCTPAWAGGNFIGLDELYNSCNYISSQKYEGSESMGKMIITRRDHPNIAIAIKLSPPILLKDYRTVRKLLEISSYQLNMLCDSGYIYGFGHLTGDYNEENEDLFEIEFIRHMNWELSHANHTMMRVVYGQPMLPKTNIDREKFNRYLKRIFNEVDPERVGKLWELITEATKQKHGTIIVVTTGAANEAERLEKQSIRIDKVELTPEIMRFITAIDGAILLDTDSACYAIGTILDGIVKNKGDSSRGARYNSAVKYLESSKYPSIAIVVSEDGYVDLMPDLRPQIRRSEIVDVISSLRKFYEEKSINVLELDEIMKWLYGNEFYLLPEMCEEINHLRNEIEKFIEKKRNEENLCIMKFVYNELLPNGEMNESYFIEE